MKQENKDKVIRRSLYTPTELRVRESAEGEAPSRTIVGYAILFNVPSAPLWSDDESEAREVIDPSAVTEDLLKTQDIKMTMFHDRQLILARSNKGAGTLSYSIDDKGVAFEFEAPHTADGDKALELVKRGDISGCSFAFTTHYWDRDFVERTATVVNGVSMIEYRVKGMTGIYDFTLAIDPAYPDTSVEAREFAKELEKEEREIKNPKPKTEEENKKVLEQLREMQIAANKSII